MNRKFMLIGVSAALATGSLAATATTAHATMYDSDRGTWSIDEEFDFCGFTVHHVENGTFNWHQFEMTGPSAGVFKNHTLNVFTGVFTNEANGKFFTEQGHNQGHGIGTAPIVYDNVHATTILEQGWDEIRDMSGALMARQVGSYTVEYLFDDGGDNVPGGSVVGDVTVTRVSGLHPLDEMTEEQFCGLVTAALGD